MWNLTSYSFKSKLTDLAEKQLEVIKLVLFNTASTSCHTGGTQPTGALPPESTRKLDKVHEMAVFAHWQQAAEGRDLTPSTEGE